MDETQYRKGVEQFAQMVGRDHIDALRQRFPQLSPDFERSVMGFIGGEVWSRPGLDLRTRSLCSIAVLAALGRVNPRTQHAHGAQQRRHQRGNRRELFSGGAWDGLTMVGKVFRQMEEEDGAKK